MSASEQRRDEQRAADQQGEGDTADDRENALPAMIGRLGAGSGMLCRSDARENPIDMN
jgi:hypothetical protein